LSPRITVNSLSLQAGGVPLFGGQRLSLDLLPGVVNLLVAANGAGKSTLLDVLANPQSVRSRRIKWSGITTASQIAYLPQKLMAIDDIFVSAFLRLAFSQQQMSSTFPINRFLRLAKKGLTMGELSGGDRQLLLFLSIAYRPQRAQFYDEPFRFLDESRVPMVSQLLKSLACENRLVVITDHGSRGLSQDPLVKQHYLERPVARTF
jgi:ABC-type multidrug transport system ATPase subunit